MHSRSWIEISVTCDPRSAEAVAAALLDLGAGGVQIEGQDPVWIRGSLPDDPVAAAKVSDLEAKLARFEEFGLPAPALPVTQRILDEENWAELWKRHFKPFRVGRRLIIKPGWESYEPLATDLVLELDPGMAFGTGSHPTTRLCLEALEERVRAGSFVGDVGTGSGILAIAAARLGAARVLATDTDRLPREIAQANVARNGLDAAIRVLTPEAFYSEAAGMDVVVANIVANTIVELAPTLAGCLRPEGVLLASGIVTEHQDLVSDALEAAGLAPVEFAGEDIWVCIAARKTGLPVNEAALSAAASKLPALAAL